MLRLSSRRLRIVSFGLFALVLARNAAAQARVVGTVIDDTGKAIKAASVTAENADTGQSFTATTDDKGHFTMFGLRPGQWKVLASAPGYLPEAGSVQLRTGNNNPAVTIAIRRSGVSMGALGSVSAKDLQTELAAADAAFTAKRWDEAIAGYRSVLAKAPSISAIKLQIASAYRAKGDYAGATTVYDDILAVEPTNQKAIVGLSAVNIERNDPATAESILMKAADNPAAGRDVYYQLGELRLAKGDTAGAMGWFEKAAAADASWGKPLYKLGLNAIQQGNRTAAANYMTRAITVDPSSTEAGLAKAAIDQLNK